uniref:C2H2-type domain-containing protein n=1 Tax=Octopus bimaculoides TaxID=37653 RepID=A0A0L8H3A5_OCTBM
MESLLRAVLTSPPDLPLPTKVDNVQQNTSTRATSPYLHAALTTTLHHDPHIEQSHGHGAAEQATVSPTAVDSSGEALGEHESKQKAGEGVRTVAVCNNSGIDSKKPSSLISNRHSKLLEALTSDFRLSTSRLRAALTTPLLSPLQSSLMTTAPPVPQPPLETNSLVSSADPNPPSNAAPYKSKLFLALTSPLEYWDKDLACSKEPNSVSDSNKTHCPGKTSDRTVATATKAVGKTIKQENAAERLDASPAEIEPKNTTTTTTTVVTGWQQCYQHRSPGDAIKSELPVPPECLSSSFQPPSKNNATPYHSELHNTVFHESPECTKSRSALVDRLQAAPVCSFVDSHRESKKREMQSCPLGSGKHFQFSPEAASFDQKIKTESTTFGIGQSSLEHKQNPTCAVKSLPNVTQVSHKHDSDSAVCVDISEGRQLCKEEFDPHNTKNLVGIGNTEQSGKSTVCVAVSVEKQLSEEEVIPHNEKNVVKIGPKMKRMHFRKKLLTRSKSPSRPSGISVAKKRKFLDHCKSRLENSDPTFSMDSSSSLLEHLVCKKQKVENVTKQNLEEDEGSNSNFDNQIITDNSSCESLENSVSDSVKNDDNYINGDGVSSCLTLQENLPENFSKCQRESILQSTIKGPKSDVKPSCDSKLGSARNSSSSRTLWEKNTGYPNNSPATKSQILREALTSAPISLHKPSLGLMPAVPEFEKMNGMTTDLCDSVTNNHSSSQDPLTKEQDQNKQTDACKTPNATLSASEKPCKPAGNTKHSSQLLLAALTAADDLRKTPVSKPITRQTNSEILRAALDSSERADSLNYHSKHSQLLRAALIAVDTNKAIKEKTHEIGPKNSNSRLLRAVLTGKYSPETDRFCHSKTSSSPPLPSSRHLSVASMPLTGNKNTSGVKNVSQDTTKSSVNTGSSRASGHSILRAVLTGALDVPQQSVTNSSKGSAPQARRQSRRRRRRSELDLKPNHGGYFRNSDYNMSQTMELTSAANVNDNPQTTDIAMKTEQPKESTNNEGNCETKQLQNTESCVRQRQKTGNECIYCGRVHSSDDTLWLYTSLFASKKQHHFCHVCRQTFSITCLFLQHVEQHHDAQTKYRCEFCGRYFVHVLSYIMCRLSHMDAQKEEGKASNDNDRPLECQVKHDDNLDVQKGSKDNNNKSNNNNNNNDDDNKINGFYIPANKTNYKDNNDDNNKNTEDGVSVDGCCRRESGDCKLCKNGLFQHRINCCLHETNATAAAAVDEDDCTRAEVSSEECTGNCRCHCELHHLCDQIHDMPTTTTKDNHVHNSNSSNNNNCCNDEKTFQCMACTKWFLSRKELCTHKQLHLDIPAGEHRQHREKKGTSDFQGDPDAHQCSAPVLTNMHLGCNSCGALHQSRQKYRTPCLWNNCSGDTAVQLHSDSRCLQLVKD